MLNCKIRAEKGDFELFSLAALSRELKVDITRLPFSIKILLENILRHQGNGLVTEEDIRTLARYPNNSKTKEIPFMPARVILQDFTGVPVVVDLAAMRDAMKNLGGNPKKINPVIPVDLVIDHSVQVDSFGTADAFTKNVALEFERNKERYAFLRWAQKSFKNLSVVPPGTGICHQVNLEYLAKVVQTQKTEGGVLALPDSVLGTDSHTTMINGLGVFGWGVGGIEAEACMLGQPYYMLVPEVVGFKLRGELPTGATATDLVLTVTNILRKKGVVGKFVEFYGSGLSSLSLPDRATLANMAPEYGATMGFFPVDQETLRYLNVTGRGDVQADLVERYCKEQGIFRTDATPDPVFNDKLELDLSTVEPCLAGPRRPQDQVPLKKAKQAFNDTWKSFFPQGKSPAEKRQIAVQLGEAKETIADGSVVIAAITSCTNTSNPSVMLGAGLLAKKAVERGLKTKAHVKTSLAPGSKVVTEYLKESGLLPYLEKLGFYLVGYGCTTCIGNSGPLPEPITKAIKENNLVACAVLSGNRNFEGRINPQVKASYLASPPLVVAYALAGKVDFDPMSEAIGNDQNGKPVFLRDIWPKPEEVQEMMNKFVKPAMFNSSYGDVFKGDIAWNSLPTPQGDLYSWDSKSTYIKDPPFFKNLNLKPSALTDITGARVLAVLGDSVTTDHISPAGSIPVDGPAGQYLVGHGVGQKDFNSFGARRGNDEVMTRGTFANIRIKNVLAGGTEGGWTTYLPGKEKLSIYDAATRYQKENVPLVVIAGKEYGSGSSRDWAAKGTALLGIKATIAESYERIHRSNLVGMGVLPLEFKAGQNRETLKLSGTEIYDIEGIAKDLVPNKTIKIQAKKEDGTVITFQATARLDSATDIEYYRNGGILQCVLRQFLKSKPI